MKNLQFFSIVAAVVLAAVLTAGCDGTGGMGGQGICLKDNSDCTVNITITDGGTNLANPSSAEEKPPTATSKPASP